MLLLDPFTGEHADLAVQSGAELVFTSPPATVKGDVCGDQAFTGDPVIRDVDGNVSGGDYILEDGKAAYIGGCGSSPEVTDMLALAMDKTAKPMLSGAIGGKRFDIPGTYSAASLTVADNTNVTLNGGVDDIYLFQSGSYIITGENTHFILEGGVQAKNIIFALTAAATTGAGSTLHGSILAGAAATFGARSEVSGYVLAKAAVTIGAGCFLNKAGLTAITDAFGEVTSPIQTVITGAKCFTEDDPVTGHPTFVGC
jgi:hypothetical protein